MSEELAKKFHETYERLAPDFGYKTRDASAVPWEDVPEANKNLMIAVCAELETKHATLLANVDELIDAITAEGGWGEGVMDAMVVISPDKFVDIEQERKG